MHAEIFFYFTNSLNSEEVEWSRLTLRQRVDDQCPPIRNLFFFCLWQYSMLSLKVKEMYKSYFRI